MIKPRNIICSTTVLKYVYPHRRETIQILKKIQPVITIPPTYSHISHSSHPQDSRDSLSINVAEGTSSSTHEILDLARRASGIAELDKVLVGRVRTRR